MNTDDTDRQRRIRAQTRQERAGLLPAEGRRETRCMSSSEPGVKHAHNLKPRSFLSGRACLTPGSEEEKAKAGEPRASLHTDLSSLISVIGVIRVQ